MPTETLFQPSDAMRSLPLFENSPEQVISELANAARIRRFGKGEVIFREGEPSASVFMLVRGSLKTGRSCSASREVIKQVLHPITLFGELGLVGERQRQEFAQVTGNEAIVYELGLESLHKMMQNHHQLSLGILQWVGRRLRHTESRLESLIFKDARQRIVEFIRESARKRGRQIGYETLIRHSLTQQDIANITGTSRQTVTSVFNDLRKSNLIHFNRRSILVRDLAKLA